MQCDARLSVRSCRLGNVMSTFR